jgi:hypothetical protein
MTDKEKTALDCANNQGGSKLDLEIQPTITCYPETAQNATNNRDRFSKGREFESRVYRWLLQNPHILAVTHSGVEHQFPEVFCKVLRQVRSESVCAFCCIPDFLCIRKSGTVTYVECKATKSIEKVAWSSYTDLDTRYPVWIVCEVEDQAYLQRISKIIFVDSLAHVSSFNAPFPVDQDGWITPNSRGNYSALPYRVVDLASMEPIDLGAAL